MTIDMKAVDTGTTTSRMKSQRPTLPVAADDIPADAAGYRITSFVKIEAPDGASTGDWYRYTLVNGQSSITCSRQGTRREVKEIAEEYVQRMNERRVGKRGRSTSNLRTKR